MRKEAVAIMVITIALFGGCMETIENENIVSERTAPNVEKAIIPKAIQISEKIDSISNKKIAKYSELDISGPVSVHMTWGNPKDNFRSGTAVFEVSHKEIKDLTLQGEKFKIDSIYPLSDIKYSFSTSYKSIKKVYKNKSCKNCSYTNPEYEWSNWGETIPDKIKGNSIIAIKVEFKSPTIVENGKYQKNSFNLTIISDKEYKIDPDISDCATLQHSFETYRLTADFTTTDSYCMRQNSSGRNITLDCQGHTVTNSALHGDVFWYQDTWNTTVKNCVLRDFAIPVQHQDVGTNMVLKNNIIANNTYVIKWYVDYGEIEAFNNTFHNSGTYFLWAAIAGSQPGASFYNNLINESDSVRNGTFATLVAGWNVSVTTETPIKGGGIQYAGNYWGNLTNTGWSTRCADVDADGFCDDPYVLSTKNVDNKSMSDEYVTPPIALLGFDWWNDDGRWWN